MSTADDLQARVEVFAASVIELCGPIEATPKTRRIIEQVIGAATSTAANFRAARRARSHAEFTARIAVVAEEADESQYWLGLVLKFSYGEPRAAKELYEEATELMKIFGRSAATARVNAASRARASASARNLK